MALATVEDVEVRLGRDLSTGEKESAEQIIGQITDVIGKSLRRAEDWADTLDPVPPSLTAVVINKVIAVGINPEGLTSKSESLGSYSLNESYGEDTLYGIHLSPRELKTIRRALGGITYGSIQLK